MKERFLLVNAGNTNTAVARSGGSQPRVFRRWPTQGLDAGGIRSFLAEEAASGSPDGLVLAAVVPGAAARWQQAARSRGIPVLRVHGGLNPGVPVDYPRRATLGADRVANVCAAVTRLGTPCIAVDIGTAVTFDVVTRERGYIGGVIAPGSALMAEALCRGTALLPRVSFSGGAFPPVGRSTRGAIRFGITAGVVGLVREILARLRARPELAAARTCFTGGGARRVLQDLGDEGPYVPLLTFEGLARLVELNREALREETGRPRPTRRLKGEA